MSAAASHPPAAHAPQLLAELRHAHHIIKAMLNAMTLQQKARVHEELDKAGVSGEGMTRANERLAVIDAAAAAQDQAAAPARAVNVAGIRQHARDIGGQVGDIEILLKVIVEKLGGVSDLPPGGGEATSAINCLATCAQRNAAAIKYANASIMALASEGGAA